VWHVFPSFSPRFVTCLDGLSNDTRESHQNAAQNAFDATPKTTLKKLKRIQTCSTAPAREAFLNKNKNMFQHQF